MGRLGNCPFRSRHGFSLMPYDKPYIFGIFVGMDTEDIRFLAIGQAKVGMPMRITSSEGVHLNIRFRSDLISEGYQKFTIYVINI